MPYPSCADGGGAATMRIWATVVVGLGLMASGQEPVAGLKDGPVSLGLVRFDFQRPAVSPNHWAISIDENGVGKYEDLSGAEQGPAGPLRKVQGGGATNVRLTAGKPAG